MMKKLITLLIIFVLAGVCYGEGSSLNVQGNGSTLFSNLGFFKRGDNRLCDSRRDLQCCGKMEP